MDIVEKEKEFIEKVVARYLDWKEEPVNTRREWTDIVEELWDDEGNPYIQKENSK